MIYRACEISFDPPPIPLRTCDWRWAHVDYDGPPDPRHGLAPSLEAAQAQIDEWYAAHEEPGCECVWEDGSWTVCALHRTAHSEHATPVISCDRCQDGLQDAR